MLGSKSDFVRKFRSDHFCHSVNRETFYSLDPPHSLSLSFSLSLPWDDGRSYWKTFNLLHHLLSLSLCLLSLSSFGCFHSFLFLSLSIFWISHSHSLAYFLSLSFYFVCLYFSLSSYIHLSLPCFHSLHISLFIFLSIILSPLLSNSYFLLLYLSLSSILLLWLL